MKAMQKRTLCAFLALIFIITATACAPINNADGYSIVCTVFPIYDWTKNVTEGIPDVSVSIIVDSGTDPHSYNASASDVAAISSADMLIYVGGESDAWVSDVIKNLGDKAPKTVKLIDGVCEIGHDHGDSHEHEHSAYDEHVWLSLKNASSLTATISDAISEALPENAELINNNAKNYISKINALDKKAEDSIALAKVKTLLFADRFPFSYMAKDYSLECFAAFSGCSTDSEATFETVTTLATKLDELSLSYVLVLESSDKKLAQTVIASSRSKNAEILVLDSMQSITEKSISSGLTYLSVMESNIDVLIKALGE